MSWEKWIKLGIKRKYHDKIYVQCTYGNHSLSPSLLYDDIMINEYHHDALHVRSFAMARKYLYFISCSSLYIFFFFYHFLLGMSDLFFLFHLSPLVCLSIWLVPRKKIVYTIFCAYKAWSTSLLSDDLSYIVVCFGIGTYASQQILLLLSYNII